ncbi:DNA repair protein RecN [Rubrivivax gelatinosus]|uniref:DNA repair protein RecN n=1 Tax=Rubrivivax gelatinosus TaxID=28068 RepID=A0A4R2MPT8_RUBGE|nr:DNA repair protein RecN [Rubrivivax gelatinosus]MBK1689025.1 DNA repair protein RecN [Rubrivivax gelatinosus]TCP05136.1 DNA replication and repair protein RecN [Rubrivivax gelatinosus]
MLRRLSLRDVVIVERLEIELDAGFSVLTGETGAGKSILIDALQLALGARGDAALVREGAARAEVAAEFDAPASLAAWLDEAGFAAEPTLLLRRTIDAQGKSRAWINGSPATVTQLREAADHLVDIHGQHAWQSLTRPAAVRALLDAQAGADTRAMAARWAAWRQALAALDAARAQRDTLERERERLAWQIAELDKLAPGEHEWDELNAEHQRLAHGQALLDGARAALDATAEGEPSADALISRAIDALEEVQRYDAELASVVEVLRGAQAQIEDAAHTLGAYLGRREPDPERLAELDTRLGAWVSLARRYRRQPAEIPALLAGWKAELAALDAAADLDALERAAAEAERAWRDEAKKIGRARAKAAPKLADAVTQAMQQLGMAGGRFEVALLPQDEPQAFGLETVELRVAGHAGSTPRAIAKVASGGELSRLALAIAVTTAAAAPGDGAQTLIFDEIDAGVGGAVADSVGRLMKQLGGSTQVLAVTHLAQVAACADHHFVVAKALQGKATVSEVHAVTGEARVAEVARMLGGERLTSTSRAHAEAMLAGNSR